MKVYLGKVNCAKLDVTLALCPGVMDQVISQSNINIMHLTDSLPPHELLRRTQSSALWSIHCFYQLYIPTFLSDYLLNMIIVL